MKRTKEPQQTPSAPGKKPAVNGEHRWKPPAAGPVIRPDNADSLILSLKQGRLDLRTSAARDVLAMREAIATAPVAVAQGLCRDLLAVHGVMLAALLREVSKPEQGIAGPDGAPNPLLVRYLPEIQKNILAAASALQKLDQGDDTPAKKRKGGTSQSKGIAQGDSDPLDVSTIILQLQKDGKGESS